MAYLEIKDLYKAYGKDEILKGVSFNLEEGEVLSIIGHSGSGKTTTLRSLNLLTLPDKGTISINNEIIYDGKEKIKEKDLRKKRLHFGLVFQSFNLFPQYTALKNVMMPLELREKEKKRKQQNYLSIEEIKDKSLDIITKVGLIDKINNYPHELSGGEKQRLAIARAVILGPDILCFDEPTSALDPLLTAEVLKVINEIKDKIKKTMIIVTHEMEFAKRISDKVIFMEDGKIVEEGSSIDLFENPKTKNLKQFLASY